MLFLICDRFIPARSNSYLWWNANLLEGLVALIKIIPKIGPLRILVLGSIFQRHAIRKDVHGERCLASMKTGLSRKVDLLNLLIRHRKAAHRTFSTMNHQRASRTVMGLVVLVGVSKVK